jgi:hypothetical protein
MAFAAAATLIVAVAGTAAAAPSTTARTCVQTTVVLHGHRPATTSCTRWATPGKSGLSKTSFTSCANPARTVDIYNTSYHDWCFTGTGYLAYRITNVYAISSLAWGWVRMYDSSGGWYQTLFGDGKWYYYNSTLITQICIHC